MIHLKVIQVIQQNLYQLEILWFRWFSKTLPAGSDSGLEVIQVIQVIQLISDSGDSGDSA